MRLAVSEVWTFCWLSLLRPSCKILKRSSVAAMKIKKGNETKGTVSKVFLIEMTVGTGTTL